MKVLLVNDNADERSLLCEAIVTIDQNVGFEIAQYGREAIMKLTHTSLRNIPVVKKFTRMDISFITKPNSFNPLPGAVGKLVKPLMNSGQTNAC